MDKKQKKAIETFVPEQVYTDRQEFIDFFYNSALHAIGRRTMSIVLLGQRRMGKTEIFKRVVNRLFFEQDHKDSNAAVPVFYQFPDEVFSKRDFTKKYVENFVRWYAAFHLRDTDILSNPVESHDLIALIESSMKISKGFSFALNFLKALNRKDSVFAMPEQQAIDLPRTVAFTDNSTIAVFLDEFQNTRLPHQNFSVTGFFQEAVESPRCPHFVTGSAMSILADEIIGKGALYGRFDYENIKAFSDYWGKELAQKVSVYYGADLMLVMSPIVSDRCGGNPFYITAVIRQAARQQKKIDSEEVLNELLAVDISSGFIWAELSDQVNRWITRVNEHGITKWILYLAALEKEDEIDLHRIQVQLKKNENIDVPTEKIKEILIKLARGDLLEYKSFGNWFCKINDPVLNEFLKVWGKIEVEKQERALIEEDVLKKFQSMEKRFHEYKGYLAEIFMIQVLWTAQRQTIPGIFFHTREDITIPDRFFYIDQRRRPGTGRNMEIDIYAGAGKEVWLAESKWWTNKKVGADVVENMLKQAEIVREREGKYLKTLRLWLFAHDGITREAEKLIQDNGILWSSRTELDGILDQVKLRRLPDLGDEL
ncbi:p-loop domain-containing protein [Desulfonema limicola]|uniref:P-loop domain-containing protein n=1 Tax=Desulfonema limicola TaxID=45656 RepID=A0A975BDM5_9BACT|nr:hypothetical protein [Desulfonema limicola]QTA83432.1 p-loop domain-containing protein [Desulfonema limicola]